MSKLLFALLLSSLALNVQASIFKCIVDDGSEVISNKRLGKNCKVVVTDAENTLPAPASRPRSSASVAASPSPASFPRVSEDTQKSRDQDRKHILEQELAGEQAKLSQARKELSEQEIVRAGEDKNSPRVLDRAQPYKDRVAQHERNIAAIQKELSNLK